MNIENSITAAANSFSNLDLFDFAARGAERLLSLVYLIFAVMKDYGIPIGQLKIMRRRSPISPIPLSLPITLADAGFSAFPANLKLATTARDVRENL